MGTLLGGVVGLLSGKVMGMLSGLALRYFLNRSIYDANAAMDVMEISSHFGSLIGLVSERIHRGGAIKGAGLVAAIIGNLEIDD